MKVNSVSKFSNSLLKRTVTQLGKSGALLPVVLLEVAVDTGRAYQAYKRGGATEMRERMTDDISAGVFWLFGAVWLNKLGNWAGKKFLGIKNPSFSLGQDKARNGFKQAIAANPNVSAKKLSWFKLGKVMSSIALAIGFIGWVLPKINQTITRKLSNKQKSVNAKGNQNIIENANNLFEDFNKYKKQQQTSSKPGFKGLLSPEMVGKIAHNLEHNATWRLSTIDGGILVGRTTNARTFDEGLEYGVRDAISSYFYLWAPAHIIALCNKFDKFGGLNTKIDPVSATHVSNYLSNIVKDSKISVSKFEQLMFGKIDKKKFNLIKPVLEKNKGNISVKEFCELTKANKALSKKARLMSRLQPKLDDVAILTDKQAMDVLSTGKITDPKFLYRTINRYFADTTIFGKKSGKYWSGTISDKLKFDSVKEIEDLRNNISSYVQSVINIAKKQAEKTGKAPEISMDTIKKAMKRNTIFHSGYLVLGLGVSMLFLSTLIPKFQYWITKKRTGKDGFPGVQEEKKAA